MEEWKVWLRTLSKGGQTVAEETVKEAAAALQAAALTKVEDAVGLESADVQDLPTWCVLSMKARALVKRGINKANYVYSKNGKEAEFQREVSTMKRRCNDSSMLDLAGRGASEAAITRALVVLEDDTWSVSELLRKQELQGTNFTLIPEREVWASVRAEVQQASQEHRKPFKYLDFTHKSMVPTCINLEEIGGRSSMPGCEESTCGDDQVKALHIAMKRRQQLQSGFATLHNGH